MSDVSVCPNCHHRLSAWDKFCSQCGQAAHLHQPSFWEFVHEFIGHYVALEGTLWHSLKVLLLKPGQLTVDYLQGRRVRQVLPLRLFLTFSLLFFLAVGISNGLKKSAPSPDKAQAQAAAAASAPASQAAADPAAERREAENKLWLARAPYGVMATLPLFAALLALTYRSRRRRYGEHFVFALHLHATWYLCLLVLVVAEALPRSLESAIAWASLAYACLLHPCLALHRVYGGRLWANLLRWLALFFLHLCLTLMMIVLISFLTQKLGAKP